jgi:hypothetical protein
MKAVNRTCADLHQTFKSAEGVFDAAAWSFVSRSSSEKKKNRRTDRSTGSVAIGAGARRRRNHRAVMARRIANERRLKLGILESEKIKAVRAPHGVLELYP